MAQLETYTVDATINNADTVIGADSANSNVTRRFRMDAISTYVRGNVVIGDIGDVTATEYAILDGATVSTAELNILDGVTATTAEINLLDGVTATTTEINYIDGVTSSIQTQLNAKQGTLTGATSALASTNLTASRALVSNASGKLVVSDVTSTELGYLDGVTSSIQTQLNGKTSFAPSNTGSANQVLQRTASGYQWANANAVSYTLPTATASTLGGVIVAANSDIDISATGALTLGNLSANKITSGTLGTDRIPTLEVGKLSSAVSGTNSSDGYVLTSDGSGGMAWEAAASGGHTIQNNAGTGQTARTNLRFSSPLTVTDNSGDDATIVDITLAASDLPNLTTAKITSGVFDNSRLSATTPSDGQVLTYSSSTDTMNWSNKGSATVTFGSAATEIATWAEGNSTADIPGSRVVDVPSTEIAAGTLPDDVLIGDQNGTNGIKYWTGTLAEYNAIVTKDDNTIYYVDGGTNVQAVGAADIGAGTLPTTVLVANQHSGEAGIKIWTGTETEYQALATKDNDTYYFTTG